MGVLLVVNIVKPPLKQSGPLSYQDSVIAVNIGNPGTVMGDLPNSRKVYERLLGNGTMFIGVVTNGSDIAYKVYEYLRDTTTYVLAFKTEEDLIKCAAVSTEGTNCSKLTTGISFNSKGVDKEFSYRIFIDREYIKDVNDGFVDPFQVYCLLSSYLT